MAFPNDITNFLRAVDPSTLSDVQNILEYQRILKEEGPSAAQTFLNNNPSLLAMNLNASRFNEIIDEITAIENFYLNNIEPYIETNINAYKDINYWSSETTYSIGNLVAYNSKYYKASLANINIEPEVATDWEKYWSLFIAPQSPRPTPVQSTQPTGQGLNSVWFKELT